MMGIVFVAFLAARAPLPAAARNDDVNFATDQLSREVGEPVNFSCGVAVLDNDILALDVAEVTQTLLEGLDAGRGSQRGCRT